MAHICFEVTSTAVTCQVQVDGEEFPFAGGDGCKDLADGVHTLEWEAVGNPGDTIDITGKDGDVVVVTKHAVVQDDGTSEGTKDFMVPAPGAGG